MLDTILHVGNMFVPIYSHGQIDFVQSPVYGCSSIRTSVQQCGFSLHRGMCDTKYHALKHY
jgi:hypothetical protein